MAGESIRVGVVGAAVPSELVLAAGCEPLRMSGRARATPLVDAYGFEELDPSTAAVMEQLLEPGHGLDFVLIGSDTHAQTVLFRDLRELQRVEPQASVPPFALVDLLHLPHRTTSRYNRGQLVRICERLGSWAGAEVTGPRLRSAVTRVNSTRRLFGELARLRRSLPARVTGADAVRLIGEALVCTPERAQRRLQELLVGEASLPRLDGKRVYLTGSAHEDDSAYEAIEARGYVVVGEDHPRGELAFAGAVADTRDPVDGLVEHYQYAPLPTRLSSRRRGVLVVQAAQAAHADLVVCFTDAHDPATPWDLPAIRQALKADGLPLLEIGPDDLGAL
ncbi:MAG TPA: 2-hydroxyacyl-CoA dehydratase family protein [Solirubrobacteraceae bacterium]|nr:2-hydroxyacyl-CoA dehydratase family protein [Solirubrobacteraceae bacterium]